MAHIYGTGRAWAEITEKLTALKLSANSPKEITTLLESCTQDYKQQMTTAMETLEDEITLLEQAVNKGKKYAGEEMEAFLEKLSPQIEQAEATLDLYQQERSVINPLRSSLRTRREAKKLRDLKKVLQDYKDELEKPIRAQEAELEYKKGHQEQLARDLCQQTGAQIDLLKVLSNSQELANSLAEQEMLEHLQKLPDHYSIINHVNLQVRQGFRLQGKWLIRGQIDHLIACPAGLFAIQVKSWSKQRNEKTAKGNAGEQLNDAAQLCYLMIKPEFPTITVRSILAYRGYLPENENTGFAKVLPLQDVCSYIAWFKENTLSERQLQELVSLLDGFSNQNFPE